MLGAIIGDIVGSRFEKKPKVGNKGFTLITERSRFTDDTVLTVAVADAILNGLSYESAIRQYYKNYPNAGYGRAFKAWAQDDHAIAYESYGNGSAMRSSPIGWAFNSMERVVHEAIDSAVVSHNHPEGVKGSKAIAMAVYMARQGCRKREIKEMVMGLGYPQLDGLFDAEHIGFDSSCQGTVPQAVWAFLVSKNFEDAVRTAVMMGGDADTIASMTGAIAHAYYKKIPQYMLDICMSMLPDDLLSITERFMRHVGQPLHYTRRDTTTPLFQGVI